MTIWDKVFMGGVMRIVFMGTPQDAVPFLELLLQKKEEIVGVVTRQDKPCGRGHVKKFPPVKECAVKYNLSVFQPAKIKTDEFFEEMKNIKPDLIVVVAYGKILPEQILDLPPLGCVNIHFSLLPQYRGSSPVQWAIIKGENMTGATSMFMDKGMDTGEIILKKEVVIEQNDNVLSLKEKLIKEGCVLLEETINLIKQGKVRSIPQSGQPSYASLLKKEDGKIDFKRSAQDINNLVRGMVPWPGAYILNQEKEGTQKVLKIIETDLCTVEAEAISPFMPGQIVEIRKPEGAVIKCGEGFLLIKKVHPENKKIMDCYQYLQGKRLKVGDYLK